MRPWRRAAETLTIALLLSCSDDGGPRVVADLAFVQDPLVVTVGTSRQLTVRVLDDRGRRIDGVRVAYQSVDSLVARVSASGVVNGVARGNTAIHATVGAISRSVAVYVAPPVSGIAVQPTSLDLTVGATSYLLAYALDPTGAVLTNFTLPFRYTSTDTTVIRVGLESASVEALVAGSATLVVRMDTITINIPVTVGIVPTTIATTPTTHILAPGDSFAITAQVLDGIGQSIPGATFTYASDDPALLRVTSAGMVTSISGGGSGTISVRSGALVSRVGVLVGGPFNGSASVLTYALADEPYAVAWHSNRLLVSQAAVTSVAVGDFFVPGDLTPVSVGGAPLGVAINHAGTRGFVAHANGVAAIDLATRTVAAEFPAPRSGNNYDVEVSLDDQRIFLANEYGVYALNATTGATINRYVGVGMFALAHHPALARLYALETGTGDVLELDAESLSLRRRFRAPLRAGPKDIAIAPDGSELYLAAQGDQVSGQIQVWDLVSGQLVQQVMGSESFGVAASPPYLLVTASQANEMRLYDRRSRVLLATVPASSPRRPATTSGGVCFFVPAEGGQVLDICR